MDQKEERRRDLAVLVFQILQRTSSQTLVVSLPLESRRVLQELIERATHEENIRGDARRIAGHENSRMLATPEGGRLCWAVHTALPLGRLVSDQETIVEYVQALIEMALADPEAVVMSGIIEREVLRELRALLIDWKPESNREHEMVCFCDPEAAPRGVPLYKDYPLAILMLANAPAETQRHRAGTAPEKNGRSEPPTTPAN